MSYERSVVNIYEDTNGGITCSGHHPGEQSQFNTDETIAMLAHMLDHVRRGDRIDAEVFYNVAIRNDLSGL